MSMATFEKGKVYCHHGNGYMILARVNGSKFERLIFNSPIGKVQHDIYGGYSRAYKLEDWSIVDDVWFKIIDLL